MRNSTFGRATDEALIRGNEGKRQILPRRRGADRRRGSALVASMVVFVAVAGLVVATSQLSSVEIEASRRSIDDVRATALAESGVERTKAMLADAAKKTGIVDPLAGVRALFGGAEVTQTFLGEPMLSNGANVGEFTSSMELVSDSRTEVVIRIVSTGYVPAAPANLGPGQALEAWDTIEVTIELDLAPSQVFDSAYFVNNWGWLYGSTIDINGNARSNGQMDLGGYSPMIAGSPTFDSVDWSGGTATMGSRNSDGGLYSSWDIVNAQNGRGIAGDSDFQFDFEDPVEMPNLSDLSTYETRAMDEGASITIGGATVADGVVGDGVGEGQNLYLEGTLANPIEINGPVVVRGDVIITGYVTGQGTIYTGGNVYVPDSIQYVNGPSTTRPTSDSDADIAAWISANQGADFLGLFARESVVVGDFTNEYWQRYVGHWLGSPLNASHEDSGADLIPNTAAGRDGVLGTADDDLLEGDGVFTTELYTLEDEAAGLIPDGFGVGDRIPGSGEDIDGDGEYDDTLTLADFDFQDPLEPAFWEGNMTPSGITDYSAISTLYANHLDASFYTNHAFSWVVFGSDPAVLNGAMIARNESIVYGTPSIAMNHDARLLGGATGMAGDLLPLVLQPMRVLQWRRVPTDPFQAAP